MRRAFVEFLPQFWNPTKAARAAGYKHPSVMANRLMKVKEIRDAITDRLDKLGMEADEITARLSDIARADMGDYLLSDGSIDLDGLKEDGKTYLIKKYKVTRAMRRNGPDIEHIEIETHDPMNALVQLAKVRGIFAPQRTEVSGRDGGPIETETTLKWPTGEPARTP